MCWHKWDKWKVTATGVLREWGVLRECFDRLTYLPLAEKDRVVIGRFEEQRRECEKCGKAQLRRLET